MDPKQKKGNASAKLKIDLKAFNFRITALLTYICDKKKFEAINNPAIIKK
ncbi:hypothetical protein [Flavobacterium sp. KMS]|nr:hypothetical protein [Flavobacterium sp. KMS]